ncbi:MAG: hypothetical protein GY782_02825 [Gammaproteobacteria bacterium]|nr:hypothetical protein [Gammaproteobacteria bacterium]
MLAYKLQITFNICVMGAQVKGQGQIRVTKSSLLSKIRFLVIYAICNFFSYFTSGLGLMGLCMKIAYKLQITFNIGFMGAQVKGQGQIKVTKSSFLFKIRFW